MADCISVLEKAAASAVAFSFALSVLHPLEMDFCALSRKADAGGAFPVPVFFCLTCFLHKKAKAHAFASFFALRRRN